MLAHRSHDDQNDVIGLVSNKRANHEHHPTQTTPTITHTTCHHPCPKLSSNTTLS